MGANRRQQEPTGARNLQKVTFGRQNGPVESHFGCLFGVFREPLGLENASKIMQQITKVHRKSPKGVPKSPKGAPKDPKGAPKAPKRKLFGSVFGAAWHSRD